MHSNQLNKIICVIIFVIAFHKLVADVPIFRVLAPEFICPNDEAAAIDKPDNTIITPASRKQRPITSLTPVPTTVLLKHLLGKRTTRHRTPPQEGAFDDASELKLEWNVRWVYVSNPTQRFTLLLWKTVRSLEAKLNAPQPEPYVYIIDNAELLQGVEYVFNVTAFDLDSDNSTTKTFSIDNIKGDSTLLIEGRSDKFSVLLIGGETVFVDMVYIVEATITTCSPTQDYYFVWSVRSLFASPVNTSDTSGSRLEIHPYSLQAGVSYYTTCAVYRNSGEFVTQTGLPLQVLYRGLAVSLSLDVLVVTANNGFEITAFVENHDHYDSDLEFQWSCNFENEPCENFQSIDMEILLLPSGLPNLGQYEITLTVSVREQQASSNATVIVIEPFVPVIEVKPQHRWLNANSMVTLEANASNIAPTCTLAWYFATDDYLASLDYNVSADKHGEELPGSITITSLEENFLNELTDFSNETAWRQVVTQVWASSGRARLVAQCGCSLAFNCDTQGTGYADVNFILNESPEVFEIKISPESGTAMETMFRLSTPTASDPDEPLRYSFYCSLGTNDTLLLASHFQHSACETLLPFIDVTGTKIWVEVCDSLKACSFSEIKTVQLVAGEGRSMPALLDSIRGHMARCEMMLSRKLIQGSISTYVNADQEETLSKFTEVLLEILAATDANCIKHQEYLKLLDWLIQTGIDIDFI